MARRFTSGADVVAVEGLDEFRAEIKALKNRKLTAGISAANYKVSKLVEVSTKMSMAGGGRWLDNAAARTVLAQRRQDGGQVSIGPISLPDGRSIPATGVEFGARQNRQRLVKNTGGRATIVRPGEDIGRVRANVERQFVGSRGSVSRRSGSGQQVQVVRTVKGWNQFRPWRGKGSGAGYFLYPTIRRLQPQIAETYAEDLRRLYAAAFPERDALNRAAS